MPIQSDSRLGPYEIHAAIGGGVGVVYKGRGHQVAPLGPAEIAVREFSGLQED